MSSTAKKAILLDALVESRTYVTPTVFKLRFTTQPAFEFLPGQFLSIVIPGRGPQGRDLRRAYSIASSPDRGASHGPIELCIKLVEKGPGTNYLNSLNPGDVFKAQGPFGDFVYKTPAERHVCFLATGTGIAPFHSMMGSPQFLASPPQTTLCLFGARGEDELLYGDFFKSRTDVQFVPCITGASSAWKGQTGRITDYLKEPRLHMDWARTDFYMCGNGAMIAEARAFLTERGVPKEAVFQEKYY